MSSTLKACLKSELHADLKAELTAELCETMKAELASATNGIHAMFAAVQVRLGKLEAAAAAVQAALLTSLDTAPWNSDTRALAPPPGTMVIDGEYTGLLPQGLTCQLPLRNR